MGVMPGSRRTNGIKDLEKQCPHRLKIEIVKKNYQVKYILANEREFCGLDVVYPPKG
jgi:hypothetical protein